MIKCQHKKKPALKHCQSIKLSHYMYFGDQQMYFVGLISSCLIITYHCEILFMKLIVLVIHSLIAQILVLRYLINTV